MTAQAFRTNVLLRSEQAKDQVSVIENLVPAGWSAWTTRPRREERSPAPGCSLLRG